MPKKSDAELPADAEVETYQPSAETDEALAAEAERIDEVVDQFEPDPEFARGDCRDAMLEVLRTTADWSKLGEQRQRDINAAIDQAAGTIVRKLVEAIAAEGRETITAKLEQVTLKGDNVKLVLTAPFEHDSIVMLAEAQGGYVVVAEADGSHYDGARAPARVDPDQPELPERELAEGEVAEDEPVYANAEDNIVVEETADE